MSNVSGVTSFPPIDWDKMDVGTAMMAVQMGRISLLDTQLQQQIDEIQSRNELTAQLNQMQADLNGMKTSFPSDAEASDTLPDTPENREAAAEYSRIADELGMDTKVVVGQTTKGDLETALAEIKSQIDSASNSQQMDMLRLQSLMGKRSEAAETGSNTQKKEQDNKSSIIRNIS